MNLSVRKCTVFVKVYGTLGARAQTNLGEFEDSFERMNIRMRVERSEL